MWDINQFESPLTVYLGWDWSIEGKLLTEIKTDQELQQCRSVGEWLW